MKSKILWAFCLICLVACSSKQRSTEDDNIPAPIGAEDSAELDGLADEKPEAPPPQVTSRDDAQILAEAVKSQNEEAIARAAKQVLSKNPNDGKALNALGYYHYRKGQLSAALLMFGKAQKAMPSDSSIQNNIGLTLLAQKEQRAAIQAFRKALELNSGDENASANLGSLYVENKEYAKAIVVMEMGYRRNSNNQKFLNNYGVALAATGKYNDARDMYKKALALNQNSREVLFNYAVLLIDHLKKYDEGLDLVNKVKFLGPSPETRNRINILENKAKTGVK